ncbi:CZB domain-containing protein [Sulfurimonas sp. C5]|uniref:CZB domain-containing protein n=1 Tax=Sulfurimonas sp. C5 TaxID=3036947 RepID=UPI0024580866|nr:CZB domain-containing protein [Sulfurimonas sp. C5]MDH4944326.1 CZB domain-containing protein [Sulfurimonas sp. C5]
MENSNLATIIKIDHIVYKNMAYSAVISESLNEISMCDHDHCSFGHWYHGEGEAEFGHTKAYIAMKQPHKTIHTRVTENMKFVKEKSVFKNKEVIIKNFSEMEEASSELFRLLDIMVQEAHE